MLRTYSVWKPVLGRSALALVAVATFVIGCSKQGLLGGGGGSSGVPSHIDKTNMVYLEVTNGATNLVVSEMFTNNGYMTNVIGDGNTIMWTNTNNWDLAMVFSRKNNPDADNDLK